MARIFSNSFAKKSPRTMFDSPVGLSSQISSSSNEVLHKLTTNKIEFAIENKYQLWSVQKNNQFDFRLDQLCGINLIDPVHCLIHHRWTKKWRLYSEVPILSSISNLLVHSLVSWLLGNSDRVYYRNSETPSEYCRFLRDANRLDKLSETFNLWIEVENNYFISD